VIFEVKTISILNNGGKMKQFIFLCLGLFLLTGCGTMTVPVDPQKENSDYPPLDQISSAEVGETMVRQANLLLYKGFKFTNKHVYYRPFTDIPASFFGKNDLFLLNINGSGEEVYCGLLRNADLKRTLKICRNEEFFKDDEFKQSQPIKGEYALVDVENFQRSLIYTGKSKDVIYISYREFKNDMARPAFTQDLTFDTSDDKIFGIKGARIELFEATNSYIKYKLLSRFKDRQK